MRHLILALLFVGLFFTKAYAGEDSLPGVAAAPAKVQTKQEDCRTCAVWKGGNIRRSTPAVPNMVCFAVTQGETDTLIFHIGKLPAGQSMPDTAPARVALVNDIVQGEQNLLPTPLELSQKLRRGTTGQICFGAWRLRGADFVYLCNGQRTAVLWRADLDEKVRKPEAGAAGYEPIMLKRP